MATGRPLRPGGLVAMSEVLDEALSKLGPAPHGSPPGDGFLYSGNRHETVPRALFVDRRLTPLERNAWQVFRLRLRDDGVTSLPTYDELRPYLASMPCTAQASHETVARALTVLRLTRWLSLVRRRRDARSGRILGNLYVLHDEPLTPFEAMQLDPDYLGLVSHALIHAAKAVQRVGAHVLNEIANDPLLSGRTLPTRLQVLARHLAGSEPVEGCPPASDDPESEASQDTRLRNSDDPSSGSEDRAETAPDGCLRNPKEARTVRKGAIAEVRTVPGARVEHALRLPERFAALKEEQRHGAMAALQHLDDAQRQAVLDEWAARCSSNTVRNPAGYLFGIIQKAIRGEFTAWAVTAPATPPSPQSPSARTPHQAADPDVVRAYVERIRASLRDP